MLSTRACPSPGGISSYTSRPAADLPGATATPRAVPDQAGHTGKDRLSAIAQVADTANDIDHCSAYGAFFDTISDYLAIEDAAHAMIASTDWAIEILSCYGLRRLPRKLDRPQGYIQGACIFVQGLSAAMSSADIFICRSCNATYRSLVGLPISKCFAHRGGASFIDAGQLLRRATNSAMRRIDLGSIQADDARSCD